MSTDLETDGTDEDSDSQVYECAYHASTCQFASWEVKFVHHSRLVLCLIQIIDFEKETQVYSLKFHVMEKYIKFNFAEFLDERGRQLSSYVGKGSNSQELRQYLCPTILEH